MAQRSGEWRTYTLYTKYNQRFSLSFKVAFILTVISLKFQIRLIYSRI